jgi:hypothetical protein
LVNGFGLCGLPALIRLVEAGEGSSPARIARDMGRAWA